MMKRSILHISDLHFGPPHLAYVRDAVLKAAKTLNPDAIAITGDFTQRARREQFAEAAQFIQDLKKNCAQIMVVPGNHDIPLYRIFERLVSPYALYKKYISPSLDTFESQNGIAFACLNTTHPYKRIKEGYLSASQIEQCKTFFKKQPSGCIKLILMHHHIFPVPSFEDVSVLSNAKPLIDIFTSLKIDAVLSGHIHRGYVGNSLDVYSGIQRDYGVLAISCGTTTSRRGRGPEREKNSFNLIEVDEKFLRVSHHIYFSADKAFIETSKHSYARPQALESTHRPNEE